MKSLIFAAFVVIFGAQIVSANTETKCLQCHVNEPTPVRIVREFR